MPRRFHLTKCHLFYRLKLFSLLLFEGLPHYQTPLEKLLLHQNFFYFNIKCHKIYSLSGSQILPALIAESWAVSYVVLNIPSNLDSNISCFNNSKSLLKKSPFANRLHAFTISGSGSNRWITLPLCSKICSLKKTWSLIRATWKSLKPVFLAIAISVISERMIS